MASKLDRQSKYTDSLRARQRLPSPSGRGTEGEGELHELESRFEHFDGVQIFVQFSLTPALSRWERENRSPSLEVSSDPCNRTIDRSIGLRQVFILIQATP